MHGLLTWLCRHSRTVTNAMIVVAGLTAFLLLSYLFSGNLPHAVISMGCLVGLSIVYWLWAKKNGIYDLFTKQNKKEFEQ